MSYSTPQLTSLVALRMLIGWHFLYEGIAKLINPYWTAAEFLSQSKWWFSGLFTALATSPSRLAVVDFLNSWGLVLIGLGLVLGVLTRTATVAGIVLLFLYYIANPPFPGYAYTIPREGNYIVVDKNLIELAALFVTLAFPTGRMVGLDRLFLWRREAGGRPAAAAGGAA